MKKFIKVVVTIFCSFMSFIMLAAMLVGSETEQQTETSVYVTMIILAILFLLPVYFMWFKKSKKVVENQANNTILNDMPQDLVTDIVKNFDNDDINNTINKFQTLLDNDTNSTSSVSNKVSRIIKSLLINDLSKKPLTDEIEEKIDIFMKHFNTTQHDLDFDTKELIVKGCIVRDLLAGKPNPKVEISEMPFNLKKDEILIYAFNMYVNEIVTKKERIAGSKGVSIKVMKGVYYHMGGSKGQTIETKVNQSLGYCSVAVTNQHIYIMSGETSFRIPFNKIVSIYPNGDSVIVYRDGAKNNPLMFVYSDTWFLCNILQNATNW